MGEEFGDVIVHTNTLCDFASMRVHQYRFGEGIPLLKEAEGLRMEIDEMEREVRLILADKYISSLGRIKKAVNVLMQRFLSEPWDEEIAKKLVDTYLLLGERARAVEVYEKLRSSLLGEFGVLPSFPLP